ncbi:peptidylprolyl isomerase [Bengtsoniella intestinalis]|uniref:peptidylprolyl isomerase n=1 Tax=Bengtsoniella intestinalis TaxID=3073143 RepID=UPI00391FC1E2
MSKKNKTDQPLSKAEIEAKKSNLMYSIIAIVFVLVGIAAVVWNSGIIEKNATALTINGEDYSVAEVNYYLVNSYQSFVSEYSDYIAYIGLDTSSSLRSQTNMDGTGTWYDYFLEQGIDQMTSVVAVLAEAEATGYVFDDSIATDMELYLSEISMYAYYYGYSDVDDYLVGMYGANMTLDLYTELMEQGLKATAYSYAYEDNLVYDEATLEATYAANPAAYDTIDHEYLYIYNPASSVDADGNTIEVTDEMTAAALAEAKAEADSLYEQYIAGASLSELAESSDMATYGGSYATNYSADDTVSEWLFDESRQAGDSAVLENTSYGMYYLVEFQDRYRQDYDLVNVRHILTMPATGSLTSTDEGYEEELAELNAAALEQAEFVYDEFLAGDQSEDAFATLANTYSEDTGSNTVGGLYEAVAKGEMVTAFEDWCYDESRQVGDTGIIETDYGYHVMYFCGYDLPYWQAVVSASLLEADYTAWFDALTASITVETNDFGMGFVGASI